MKAASEKSQKADGFPLLLVVLRAPNIFRSLLHRLEIGITI
jgi:hypothetical protein